MQKAVFHDKWIGLRLRYRVEWPTIFLVLDHATTDRRDLPDTTMLYRAEKIARDHLALSRKYRHLRRGFKCQGVALRHAQAALRKDWE
ncbi:hypothetical protein [Aurantiacibacter luteus]|uniref:Uncharacterized protein n=1 Tax=Aurantiacibacter luteus TaxID=1581420 RepID=A0A0G9MYI1_9SPHN|nr:hypothetical protein [Aurantiacibacter luteus]KLE35842.1 hypothetical protein AAW00_05595 [Aurantiacibacter luteus]